MPSRSRFSNVISCPGCGVAGTAQWEENALPAPAGPQRTLASLSDGFRQEQQQLSRDPAIICEHCGSRLAD